MDVIIPTVPAEYEGFREEVKGFLVQNRPALRTKRRNGLRTPEYAEDIDALKVWVRRLYEAGYQILDDPDADPIKVRVIREEILESGLPMLLGNTALVTALHHYGSVEQKKQYLEKAYSGEFVLCQLFSEPEAGSDLASLRTRAVRDGNVYVVNGQKIWTSFGQWADYGILLARTNPDVPKHEGISAFVLDMRSPGIEVLPIRMCVGTSDFNEVILDGVEIPAENLIGEENGGWRVTQATLLGERTAIFAGGTGPTARVMELFELAEKTNRRGTCLGEESVWRYRLADLYAQASIQMYNGFRVMTRAARGTSTPGDAPVSKVFASELNLKLAETALALLGTDSVLVEGEPTAHLDGDWQDWFLYARAMMLGGGTGEIMRNIIAERALALPRS